MPTPSSSNAAEEPPPHGHPDPPLPGSPLSSRLLSFPKSFPALFLREPPEQNRTSREINPAEKGSGAFSHGFAPQKSYERGGGGGGPHTALAVESRRCGALFRERCRRERKALQGRAHDPVSGRCAGRARFPAAPLGARGSAFCLTPPLRILFPTGCFETVIFKLSSVVTSGPFPRILTGVFQTCSLFRVLFIPVSISPNSELKQTNKTHPNVKQPRTSNANVHR